MKILHVITSLRTGGAEKLMIDLIPRLKDAGNEVDLLLFDGVDTPFRQEAEKLGIKVRDLGIGGSVYSPIKLFKLLHYLPKYDIIHTHNTAPQLFAAIGSLGRKVILFTTEHNTTNRRRDKKWLKPIDKWLYNRYKKVICISNKTEENLKEYVGKSKAEIITIPNGIDVKRFSEANPSQELDIIAPNSRKIIMVAAFRNQKDQDTLIRSLKFLSPNFHLFLVGEGKRLKDCQELTLTEDLSSRVHFLGVRKDIPELIKASDFFVLSSHWEGFGLAAVEGMAAGIPVLASRVNGLSQIVAGAGILFGHENSQELAIKILELDTKPEYYREAASRCKQRALDFDIGKMVNLYNNQYQTKN